MNEDDTEYVSLCTREWTEIHQRAMCFFITNYTRALYERVCTRVWLKGGAISKGKGKIAGIAKVD